MVKWLSHAGRLMQAGSSAGALSRDVVGRIQWFPETGILEEGKKGGKADSAKQERPLSWAGRSSAAYFCPLE